MKQNLKNYFPERGSGLITLLILMVILGLIAYSAVGLTTGHTKLAWFNYKKTGTQNKAEMNLERAIEKLRIAMEQQPLRINVTPDQNDLSGFVYPAPVSNESL